MSAEKTHNAQPHEQTAEVPGNEYSRSPAQPEHYAIRIKGHLHPRWSEWFDGMTVTNLESGETVLAGPVADQAALHGLLVRVRDLGLVLIAVTRVEPGREEAA